MMKRKAVQSEKMVTCDKGHWNIINDIHEFNETWIKEYIRVLAGDGTIWISDTLHNRLLYSTLLN
jgi:DNA modification methylase